MLYEPTNNYHPVLTTYIDMRWLKKHVLNKGLVLNMFVLNGFLF